MLTAWLMLGGAVGVFAACLWFRPPLGILGLSVGTIMGFFMETQRKERLSSVLFFAVAGMLIPAFLMEMENMQIGVAIGVKAFSLIGVFGQGAYALYNNWALLAGPKGNLQGET